MSDTLIHTTTPKRLKQPSTPPLIPPGHASLRILCHVSLIGPFIGKSGSSIKTLQLQTGSKIRVDDSLHSGSDLRVILIVAPSVPYKRVKLGDVEYKEDVSAAQEAALRVFEKVLEVSSEESGNGVTCRVVIEGSKAGAVIGKGGKVVERLRRENGARIRVLSGDHLRPGVLSSDEVVEIEGNVLAVKKGLLGVCGRLQQCPQVEKPSIKDTTPVESTFQPTMLNFRDDPPLQRTLLSVAATSSSPIMITRPLSFETDKPASLESKPQQLDVVFRILCQNDRVGGIMGRGGSIIDALQEESRAIISVGPSVNNCDERVVTITSKEDADSTYSRAQRAVVLVFCRSAEAGAEKGLDTGSARLLVPSNQVGCLLGRGGAIVSEMRKATGANIHMLRGDEVPKCASENDLVVQISGQFVKVQDALYQVTNRLRSNLFPTKVMNVPEIQTSNSLLLDTKPHGRLRDTIPIGVHQTFGTSQSFDGPASWRPALDPSLRPNRLDHSPSIGFRTSEIGAGVCPRSSLNLSRELAPANRGIQLGSANGPAIVTNTTVEMSIPESNIASVYGENGKNLIRIREISGAKVIMHEAPPGTRDRTIVISGTPDEAQAAQSLIHAFILTGSS